MNQLSQEFDELKKVISTFSLFGRKVQNISKLKRSFFEKMLNFEQQENIEQAQQYYQYFIRAERLSTQIYTNMHQYFEELNSLTNQTSFISHQEIDEAFDGIQNQIIQECKQLFSSFHVTQEEYSNSIKNFLQILQSQEITSKLLSLTSKEENDIQDIDNPNSDFFKKLKDQREIHQLLLEEELISNKLQVQIKELVNQTITYSNKIIEISKQLQIQFTILVQELRNSPQQFIVERFFTPLKHIIEKHSSIIALSAITLAIVANISALVGIGSIAITAKITTDAFSYSLKGVEALPSLKAIINKSNQVIRDAINKSNEILNTT
ncbi:MAG: hypothetical protein ACMXYB_03890 [Candidatus Woesearchaeota archaeon]